MSGLLLVHHVLDAQLLDRHQEKIGRVDEVLLELRDGAPPRVATLLIGGPARAARVGGWMTWLRRIAHAVTGTRDDHVSRIPFDAVRRIAESIELDVDGCALPSGHLERWLSEQVVCRIPGGRGERK
jgi:hypothetical protein